MGSYVLSRKADIDLDDITDYTLEVWGETQTKIYLKGLLQCFQSIADEPEIGRSAAEYATPLRRYPYKAHTIFYEPTDTGVFIVRVLGQRQNYKRHM